MKEELQWGKTGGRKLLGGCSSDLEPEQPLQQQGVLGNRQTPVIPKVGTYGAKGTPGGSAG